MRARWGARASHGPQSGLLNVSQEGLGERRRGEHLAGFLADEVQLRTQVGILRQFALHHFAVQDELCHSRAEIVVNVPGNTRSFALQQETFLLMQRQLRHEPEAEQDDRGANREQRDLKPTILPEEHLDRLQRRHLVHANGS